MKKVLFVATVASHIKSFHLPYLKLLKENGYEVYVAADWNIKDKDKLQYVDNFIQIPIQRSPYSTKNILAIKQLKRILNEEKFDIIHCHTPMGGVVTRLAAKHARKNGTRVIYTAHGFHFYKGAPIKNWVLFYTIEWYLAKYTDTLITINREDYERAKNKLGKRCKDIQYVPGVGIDTKKFDINMSKEEKVRYKESIGLKNDDFILTCVARLDKNKNQGFLIRCMQELVKANENIHLLLVGRDELNGYYQKMTRKMNLENNVHFLDSRDDVPQLLKISNVVVSSSKREGLPVNIIEAFASGVPVVALNCRGMSDLIMVESNGYIVYKEDIKYFCDKLLELMKNSKKNDMISKNNKEKSNNYCLESIENLMKKIYLDINCYKK